jgi:predicted tellurium resistance membrane protein TerC
MDSLFTTESFAALLTLTAMEIVLGIDNIIFISILVGKVPAPQREKIRRTGISLALFSRLALLLSISWIMGLTAPLFSVANQSFSGRDLILLIGGLFLVGKATFEIHDKLESKTEETHVTQMASRNGSVLIQLILLDIVFSLDSVITAVGMADKVIIMVLAMVIAVGVMLVSSKAIGDFVERHPTIKILALSFLLLIGVTLVVEGMGGHVNKGYIYFAIFFSLAVEFLNMHYLKKRKKLVSSN